MKRIGHQIRYYRTLRRMTQAQLAQAVGVVQSVVAGWEAETKNPIIDKLPDIAKALGVSEAQLIEEPISHV